MAARVLPARKQPIMGPEVLLRAPRSDRIPRLLGDFELNGVTCPALKDLGTAADLAACTNVSNPKRDQVAASQLAVDRQIEERQVAAFPSDLRGPGSPRPLVASAALSGPPACHGSRGSTSRLLHRMA